MCICAIVVAFACVRRFVYEVSPSVLLFVYLFHFFFCKYGYTAVPQPDGEERRGGGGGGKNELRVGVEKGMRAGERGR